MDYVVVNSKKIPSYIISNYKEVDKAVPVEDDVGGNYGKAKIIRGDLLNDNIYIKSSSDKIKRSLVRHSSDKLSKIISEIIKLA